jgi:hypothetical protein
MVTSPDTPSFNGNCSTRRACAVNLIKACLHGTHTSSLCVIYAVKYPLFIPALHVLHSFRIYSYYFQMYCVAFLTFFQT